MSLDIRPLFVARRTYRHRRMADAARLLPILGAGLFLLPLLWRSGETPDAPGLSTVAVMIYLFAAWIFLAGVAGVISRRLPETEEESPRDPET
jgi:hypothetical protein